MATKKQNPTATKTPAKPAAKPQTPRKGNGPTEDQIARRAFDIWMAEGCPNGKDQEHWLQAERELKREAAARK